MSAKRAAASESASSTQKKKRKVSRAFTEEETTRIMLECKEVALHHRDTKMKDIAEELGVSVKDVRKQYRLEYIRADDMKRRETAATEAAAKLALLTRGYVAILYAHHSTFQLAVGPLFTNKDKALAYLEHLNKKDAWRGKWIIQERPSDPDYDCDYTLGRPADASVQ